MKLVYYILFVIGLVLLCIALFSPDYNVLNLSLEKLIIVGSLTTLFGAQGTDAFRVSPRLQLKNNPSNVFCWLIANILVALVAVPCYFIFLS